MEAHGGPATGSYVLVLRLLVRTHLRIGRLGRRELPAGYYAYVGSAFGPGGLAARLGHHLRRARRPHWHIDHLRARTPIVQIWYAAHATPREHEWAALLGAMPNVSAAIRGFGSSDCGCPSHLFHSGQAFAAESFARALRARFPDDESLTVLDTVRRGRGRMRPDRAR